MRRIDDRAFAIKIGLVNAFGFAETIAAVAYLDPRLTSHVRFGARHYPCGYWPTLLAVLVFCLTFFALERSRSTIERCFASCGGLILVSTACLWLYPDEFPHPGIVCWTGLYCVSALLATWIRDSRPHLSFADDVSIRFSARLEALKGILSVWQALAIAAAGGLLAILAPWSAGVLSTNEHIVNARGELSLLNIVSQMEVFSVAIALMICPVFEIIATLLSIGQKFTTLKDDPPVTSAI